ncbi:MAG: TonB-dependent receptor, partial [Gemmatimonadota bacterium]|nr:TonB-dependent receptor [Gemmatimonadota bacterium]
LTVTHAGYEPLSLVVSVPSRDSVGVDLELTAHPVALTPLDVRATRSGRGRGLVGEGEEPSVPELEIHALEVGPGLGQAGIVDVVSAVPGNEPGDASDVLFMRGSTTDMKLVLLDGVPVYTPFHVAGLLRSFEPSVLGGAELHVGGAPARFDGGLTHILELNTRTARRDALHFSGSVDLLSSSAAVELPLGSQAGLVASGRTLHDLASEPLGQGRPYGYRDALVSFDVEPADGHALRATGFWNEESVALDLEPAQDDARWSNRAGSVGYRADVGDAAIELTAGLSGYRASLPLQPGSPPGEPPPPALIATAETNRARIVGEVLWGSPVSPIRTGLSFEHIDAAFAARVLTGGNGASSHGTTAAIGAFVDATRPLAPGVSLRAGLRVDHFTGHTARLAPRAAISWAVAPEALLTVAAGRYHQPTRTPEVDVELTLAEVAVGGVPPSELLPIATADHVVLTLDQRLSESVRLGLQGFWKAYEGLPTTGGQGVRSSGIDVRVLSGSERATAWLGYGLSWFWSTTDLSGQQTDFSGRHLLSAGVSGRLGGPMRGEARVAYGAGLPYTSVPLGFSTAQDASELGPTAISQTEFGSANTYASGLDESFLRLDVELFAVFEPNWGSRSWRVRPYLRLLNALDRRDSLFYTFERWRSDEVRPLAELPILPLVGVAVSF